MTSLGDLYAEGALTKGDIAALVAFRADVELLAYQRGELSEDEWRRVLRVVTVLKEAEIYVRRPFPEADPED